MRKKRKTASPRARHTAVNWQSVFTEVVKVAAIGAVASVGSILAYLLTPLNELVNALIWREKAQIILFSQNSTVLQGEVLYLDIFVQQQSSPVALSEGTLTLEYPRDILRPASESSSNLAFATPQLSGSQKLTEESLEFIADVVGKGEISARLQTKNGHAFSARLPIEVLVRRDQAFPTRRNFSGSWNIDLGSIHGTMSLTDRARSISGEYRLSDGRRGQVDGTRDGKTFRVTFYIGASPSRWFVEGVFDLDPRTDLEIRGKASLLIPAQDQPNPWKVIDEANFNAVAAVP